MLVKTKSGKSTNLKVGFIHLLTNKEAEFLLSQEDLYSEASYWLRPHNRSQKGIFWVQDGKVCNADDASFEADLRPVLKIEGLEGTDLKVGDIVEFGKYELKVISKYLLLLNEPIGRCCYDKDTIKKILDGWFQEEIIKKETESFAPGDNSLFSILGVRPNQTFRLKPKKTGLDFPYEEENPFFKVVVRSHGETLLVKLENWTAMMSWFRAEEMFTQDVYHGLYEVVK